MADIFSQYYRCARPELISHVPLGNHKVLDVGCAEGVFGEILKKEGHASKVVGIELSPEVAKKAKTRLDNVVCGDLESIDFLREGLRENFFDYIICADVLEHLRDPWHVLRGLVKLLKDEGRVVVSVPNVRHWSVVFHLLFRGEWTYRAHGILDRTHLRFYPKICVSAVGGLRIIRGGL